MRQLRAGRSANSARGFDARPPLDYLANVIKRVEVPMLSVKVTRFDRIRSLRTLAPRRAASCVGIFVAALLLVAAPALATTYKWTDANGRVIYSDQPPSGNFKVEALHAPPPPDNPNAAKELANKEAELQKRRQMRTEEESKAAKVRVEANVKREQCERTRGQIATLTQSDQIVIYTTNAQGERATMDNAARIRERQQLEAWLRENCKG
jgi:Skp family chaperone for outer membrane proteins